MSDRMTNSILLLQFPDNTGHLYCNAIPFFELGSVNHDYYLVNTKIGVQFQRNTSRDADLHVRLANAIVSFQLNMWLLLCISFQVHTVKALSPPSKATNFE